MKGMPKMARLKGSRRERVETACNSVSIGMEVMKQVPSHTFSGLPLKPTKVPLREYRFWEADMDAESREKELPSTSKRASTTVSNVHISFP